MDCPMCGHENELGARFCSSCGASLPTAPQPTGVIPLQDDSDTTEITTVDSRNIPELNAGIAVLVVTRGALEGVRFTLDSRGDQEITIGRSPEATIFLDDVTVSRKHAELTHDESGWHIKDSGSLNGTYVNRNLIETVALKNNDEVQVGKYRLAFIESGN